MVGKNKKLYGGFSLDSIGSTLSGWGTSISNNATSAYNKTKNAVSSATTGSTGSSTFYSPTQPTQTYSVGGRTRRRRSKRGGSYSASKSVTGLAANSSSVYNTKTAQPHNLVGGKSKKQRRHKHKHSKSCKNKKH